MQPVGTVASVEIVSGPSMISRYNMYQSATVNANAAPGVSSGQAIEALQKAANAELEPGMRTECHAHRGSGGVGGGVGERRAHPDDGTGRGTVGP